MNMTVLVPEAAGALSWIHSRLFPKVPKATKRASGLILLLLTKHIKLLPQKA